MEICFLGVNMSFKGGREGGAHELPYRNMLLLLTDNKRVKFLKSFSKASKLVPINYILISYKQI